MTGSDKSAMRAGAVIALVLLVAVALGGYLPGAQRAVRTEPTSHPAATAVVIALLSASIAVIAIAVVMRLLKRDVAGSASTSSPERVGMVWSRPTWRAMLAVLGLLIAWLLATGLLAQVLPDPRGDPPTPAPAPTTSSPEPPVQPAPPEPGSDMLQYLVAATVVLLLILAAGTVVVARRRRAVPSAPVTAERAGTVPPTVATDSLARAAEHGLAEIGDLSREPREAIIACYASMERELAHVPEAIPQEFDTPTEVLARAVEHRALRQDSAPRLVELFEEARFSPHVMTEQHRETAVQALQVVLADIRRPA